MVSTHLESVVELYRTALLVSGLEDVNYLNSCVKGLEHILRIERTGDIRFSGGCYLLGSSSLHPSGRLKTKSGIVLLHLLANVGETVSEVELARVAGWDPDSPNISQKLHSLAKKVNAKSRQFGIQYVKGADCRLYRVTN